MEDLHWVDASSDACLTALVERMAGAAILVLVTYRPGYRPPWVDKSYVTQVALQPLTQPDSLRVVQAVLPPATQTLPLVPQLLAKAEGNPFFLEELARAVVEQGADVSSLTVPDTVQAVLTARMDRLPATAKRLLQAAAVIGKDIALPLLQAVTEASTEALHGGLRSLQAAEFLYETYALTTPVYTFTHVLTQEVAYHSLVRRVRQQCHARIAHVLEAQFPHIVETQPELLAYHYTEAGLNEQAVHYWHTAAQRAVERSAHVEAISHLRQGLAVLQTLPETPARLQRKVDMLIALGASVLATQGYAAPEVGELYTSAQQICAHLEAPHQLFPVLRGLWNHYYVRAELQTAHTLGEQLLALAHHVQHPAMLVAAHRDVGATCFQLGAVAAAHTHFAQGIALYDPQQHRASVFLHGQDAGVLCRSYAAAALWYLGYPDQAWARIQEAVTLAQQLAHPFSLNFALGEAAMFHQCRREAQATQECAEATIVLATAQGFRHWRARGVVLRGWALAQQGQGKAGIEQITQGLRDYRATGAQLALPHYLALLAEAYSTRGQPAAGLTVLTEALALVDQTGVRLWEAELYRLKGALLLQQSSKTCREAETCFQHAMAIAHNQQAKSWELRAATSLAHLWQQQGKRDEAKQVLGDVYGWFTEGFDTADLQEAKALLEPLA
jgi:predicted ATPase